MNGRERGALWGLTSHHAASLPSYSHKDQDWHHELFGESLSTPYEIHRLNLDGSRDRIREDWDKKIKGIRPSNGRDSTHEQILF